MPNLRSLSIIALLISFTSAQTCNNYGNSTGGSPACLCPPGFNPTGVNPQTCDLPVCGGNLYSPAGAAPGTYGNISAGSCGCSSGFIGPGCTGEFLAKIRLKAVCTSSSACQSSLQSLLSSSSSPLANNPGLNTSLVCNTAPTVYAESQMSCNVIQATLQAIYPGASTLTITRALNASLTPGGTAAQKSVGLTYGDGVGWAQLWYEGVEQFNCLASGCDQTIGQGNGGNSSTWVCASLSCHCRPGTAFCGGVCPS